MSAPPATPTPAPAVRLIGITKRFGSILANDAIDLDVAAGEVHALLGENGAGKTTLMNILYGLIQPDAGAIEIGGRPVQLTSAGDAVALGIGMVHQHFMLVPTLTVAENVILGERGQVLLKKAELRATSAQLRELGERHGLEVDPEAVVWQLSVGERQRVEILRALHQSAKVLILDEPTASLAPSEVEELLPRLRELGRDGTSVIVITHHLDEVMAFADRITVLRNAKKVATVLPGETTTRDLARLMVAREVADAAALGQTPTEQAARVAVAEVAPSRLSVRGVTARNDQGVVALEGLDIDVRAGEIVAIAGVDGNGQAELEEVLYGLRRPAGGTVVVDGADLTTAHPKVRLDAGMMLIPSDRQRRGLVAALSVAENLVLDRIGQPPFGTRWRVSRKAIADTARELIARFSIRVKEPGTVAATLSGGNAQRVVVARQLSRSPRVLVAAQPTRGLDVGAIEFVHERLLEQRANGVGVLLISTDLSEVMALADRCYVIYRGRLVGEWPRAELDYHAIGLAMGGARAHSDPAGTPTQVV